MPIEAELLRHKPEPFRRCPECMCLSRSLMRGQVQRSRRFLGFLWKRPYCAVICGACKEIIGWEEP